MGYLLDTNMLSHALRDATGRVAAKMRENEAEVSTSVIVAAEMRFGAVKRNAPELAARIETLLRGLVVLPLESPADLRYADIRAALERRGQPIGQNDLWIAAQCLALDLTLVTDNEGEFSRVPGLRLENWLR